MRKRKFSRAENGSTSYKRGWRAEWAALIYLMAKGYFPRAMRYRAAQSKTRAGEIDIIAQRGNVIAAIEVKARPTIIIGHEAMNDAEWRRRHAAMAHFTRRLRGKNYTIRFDLVIVTPYFQIRHLKSAWQPAF
jgi:putative endonuclease